LVACSLVIAEATRSLMAGETVALLVLEDIRRVLQRYEGRLTATEVKTLHLGPQRILVALTIETNSETLSPERDLGDLSAQIQGVDGRITYVYYRFR